MDFVTHLAVAQTPGALLRDRGTWIFLIVGTFLPDLVEKGLYWIARAPYDFCAPSHSIVGAALLCYLAALFVEESTRRKAWVAMFAGALLHLFVDLWEENLGFGVAKLLYPFSTRGYEFGWVRDEHEYLFTPAAAALLLLLWLVGKGLRRVRQ